MSETKQALVIRIIKGFAFFWWDFLVGDTPELAYEKLIAYLGKQETQNDGTDTKTI